MNRAARFLAAAFLLGATAASAGNITVQNLSSVTVPETRVYKTCLCACSAQIFGSLAPGFSSTQTRTSPVSGCVWAREIDPDRLYPNCSQNTVGIGLPDPSDPAQITVTWTGTTAANLSCTITVN
ncbi:MAG TPA: hypothetical protein VF173_38315 [Thermoanaerobaculia bacterium]|nr:hypothetical protein [Thermoanaerobaculia bacterium]